jgi:hypothetical protein
MLDSRLLYWNKHNTHVRFKVTFSHTGVDVISNRINPLNAELNPIDHLLALLGAHHILHVSWIRVNLSKIFILCPY